MKRVSALICLMIMAVSILAPSCFAAKETANTQKGANFKIEKGEKQCEECFRGKPECEDLL